MHALRLAVLAARMIDRLTLVGPDLTWSAFELETYWSASRVRLDRWSRALAELSVDRFVQAAAAAPHASQPIAETAPRVETPPNVRPASTGKILRPHAPVSSPPPPKRSDRVDASPPAAADRPEVLPLAPLTDAEKLRQVAQEILVGEIHARLFSCLVQQAWGGESTKAAAAVVRSIWIGHQEVRCRLLTWLVDGLERDLPLASEVDRLRRRCDRWSDLLLARLPGDEPLAYAVDPRRIVDFRVGSGSVPDEHEPLWPLLRASLEHLLPTVDDDRAAHPQLNAQIHEATAPILSSGWSEHSLEALRERIAITQARMEDWLERCRD